MQISTRELLLDETLGPLEGSTEGDIGATRSLVRPANEQCNKLADGGDDERSRITSLREGARIVLVRKDEHLERVHIAGGEVLADEIDKPGERSDCGVGSEATLENATNATALEVQGAGVVDIIDGEHASLSKETVLGVL